MSNQHIYVIGGCHPSLLARDYNILKSCLQIDISTGILTQKKDMLSGRTSFGICPIGKRIWLLGGLNSNWQVSTTYTSYDVLRDRWTEYTGKSVDYPLKVTLVGVRKRFVYCFGGRNKQFNLPRRGNEVVCKLDTYKLGRGWEIFILQETALENGTNHGVIILS